MNLKNISNITSIILFIASFFSCKEKQPKEQQLTDLEKKYPIKDSHGNRFKTMPTVYTNKYLSKGLSESGYNYPSNILNVTYSPLWAEGKPTGFIEITEHSYQPFYEDTAKVYDKVDYIYTKNIPKWKVKKNEWVIFEPVRWGDEVSPITKVTTFAHYRLVPLQTVTLSFTSLNSIP